VLVSEFFALCPEYLSAAPAPRSPRAFGAAAAPANCTLFVFANPSAHQQTGVTLNVSAALGRVPLPQNLHWLDVYSGLVISGSAPVQQLRGALGGGCGSLPESPRAALLRSLACAQVAGREGSGSALPAAAPNSGFSASLAADILTFSMEPGGAGAVLVTPNSPGAELAEFLTIMNNISALPLASFSAAWYPRNQTMAPVPTPPGAVAQPPGMLLVPGAIGYAFTVAAALPEMFSRPDAAAAAAGPGVDVQYPWEAVPAATHAAVLDIAPFYIDAHLTTNADYQGFAWATGYNSSGTNPTNYLRHWTVALPNGTRTYNASNGDGPRPVTWVSRADAQAFCGWAGKRLPTEVEWQFAAQATGAPGPGTDYRLNPWGNQSCAAVPGACPPQGSTPATLPPPVGQFLAGNSALGIADLAGSVWQITDAFSDGATNAVVLRGGSLYQAQDALSAAAGLPSRYVRGQIDLNHHLRVPLVDDSTLRSAFVGFRCMTGTAFAAGQDM
jgi:formylglycine-generating enzyme required for sulfatase activity